MRTAAILLAAGASTRLGTPKQLVRYQGETLVRRTARILVHAAFDPVVIVTDACDAVAAELTGLAVHVVHNSDWRDGMGSSVCAGLRESLQLQPELPSVLISVCDQPFITVADLTALALLFHRNQAPIAAAEYNDSLGVPAIFRRELFRELNTLSGDAGARRIIQAHRHEVAAFPMANAGFDVDGEEDLRKLGQERT